MASYGRFLRPSPDLPVYQLQNSFVGVARGYEGCQKFLDVRGASRATSHYRIDTERNRIELWYSPEGEWLGLRSTTRDGHVLSYRLK